MTFAVCPALARPTGGEPSTGLSFRTFCLPVELVSSRKQTIYTGSWRFQILEKKPQCEYNPGVVESLLGSTRPPGKRGLPTGSRPGANCATRLEKHESSPRSRSREMGWSRNPTSFGFARRSRNHRVRRRTEFPKHAFLASPQRVLSADPHCEWPGVCPGGAATSEKLPDQEKAWVRRKT